MEALADAEEDAVRGTGIFFFFFFFFFLLSLTTIFNLLTVTWSSGNVSCIL